MAFSKMSIVILLILLILLIVIIYSSYYYYNKYYKFYRSVYYNERYISSNKLKYLKTGKTDKTSHMINPLFQTYYNKEKIPKDVYENIKKYAPEYNHIIMDDNDIILLLNTYYNDNVVDTFNSLKNGAHKADLARYCILYIYGGLYMDIKVELIKPLSEIFNKGEDVFYSVESNHSDHIHQGILKSPPNNNLFLSLIDYIVNKNNPYDYIDFCRDLYIQIKNDVSDIKNGLNIGKSGHKYYLFKEKCSSNDKSMCYDGFDRYGFCCFIWDGGKPIIKSRRSSYPWK